MFDNIIKFLKRFSKEEKKDSKDTAKERLHLVLMQDRANVSADFMELMKQEIIEVIKKYIDVDENLIDVKLTNKVNSDGTTGAPMLYANIPILNVKDDTKQISTDRRLDKEEKSESILSEEIVENKENIEEVKEDDIKETEIDNNKQEEIAQESVEETEIKEEQKQEEPKIEENKEEGENQNLEQTEVK